MPETIYGLRCEWEMRNGHYLLFSRDNPLHREDLAPLEEKMLMNVAVPRLLPLEFEEVDLSVRLRYRLPAVQSLKHFTRSHPLDANLILKLLYGIASIIDDSKTYMLNEEKYLLRQDYIWIGHDASDIHLAYIPLKSLAGKLPLQQELQQLSLELFEQARLPQAGFRKVFDYIKGPLFQIQEWKKILLSYITENDTPNAVQEVRGPIGNALPPLAAPVPDTGSAIRPDGAKIGKRSLSTTSHRSSLLLYAGIAILLGVAWTAAAAVPSEGAVLAASGFTLLLGDGVYVRLKRKSSANENKEEERINDSARPPVNEKIAMPLFTQPSEAFVPENHTVFLHPPNETVLLNPYMFENDREAALEAVRPEGNVKTAIRGDSFLIGRNAETAHWVEDTIGVSRLHMEILRKDRCWMAKDLGSKNGSSLNGEAMEPFREYELKDGDRIEIACSQFFFRLQDKRMNR